jgi:hypothetical protein
MLTNSRRRNIATMTRWCWREGAVGQGKIKKGYVGGVDRKKAEKKKGAFFL